MQVHARSQISRLLTQRAEALRDAVARLTFRAPVTHVYNPLQYAWRPHQEYVARYGHTPKRVLFLGMNPGPFGMAQTGIPFGEVRAVREWLRISAPVDAPAVLHPKRPVAGFDCPRSEVSGRRLWGLFAARFGTAEHFFSAHFVVNYCPLLFLEASGCNRTPDKLPGAELRPLREACDAHLRAVIDALQVQWIIGVGRFAADRAQEIAPGMQIGTILHPSPASPSANRDWEGTATRQLEQLGVW
jgi:single-strand selective monofunctional uracil DNA glycosylase